MVFQLAMKVSCPYLYLGLSLVLFSQVLLGVTPCAPLVFERGVTTSNSAKTVSFSDSPTIQALIALHLDEFARYDATARTGVRNKTFNPIWVFNTDRGVQLLVDQFPQSVQIRFSQASQPEFEGLKEFLDVWERDFLKAGGSRSIAWTQSQKKQFVRRWLLELAHFHQLHPDVASGKQPLAFNRSEASDESLFPGYKEINYAFGSAENFQRLYREFYRRRERVRRDRITSLDTPAKKKAAEDLSALGAKRPDKPVVEGENRTAIQETFLTESIQHYRNHRDANTPLVAVFSGGNLQLSESIEPAFANFRKIQELFGSVRSFVDQLNDRLQAEEKLTIPLDEKSLLQEILIQFGVRHAFDFSQTAQNFSGFQFEDPAQPLFLDTTDALVVAARMDLKELNEEIRSRLSTTAGIR